MTASSIQRQTLPLLFAASIAGYPLISFLPELLGVPNRLITIPFRLLVLAGACTVVAFSLPKRRLRYGGLLWYPFVIFWYLYAIRFLITMVDPPSLLDRPAAEFLTYGLGACFVPALAFFSTSDEDTTWRAYRLTLMTAVVACLGAIQFNWSLLGTSFHRAFGNEYLNPNALGHLGVTAVLLGSLGVLQNRRVSVPLSGIAMLSGVLCIALSASRGALLALAVGLLVVGLHGFSAGRKGRLLLLLAVVLMAVPVVIDQTLRLGSSLPLRVASSLVMQEREVRFVRFTDAWSQFAADLWLGSSIVERNSGTYPHNVLIESYMATGIIGGTAFSLLFVGALLAATGLVVRGGSAAWIGVLFIQYAIAAMFSGALFTHTAMWALLTASIGTAWALARNRLSVRGVTTRIRRPSGHAGADMPTPYRA